VSKEKKLLKRSVIDGAPRQPCGISKNFDEKQGGNFGSGEFGTFWSASVNFPIGRNSVGKAVKFCRKNRRIGKIGESAEIVEKFRDSAEFFAEIATLTRNIMNKKMKPLNWEAFHSAVSC
jgi:hypothetical protein